MFKNCLAFNEPESIFGLMATKLGRWTENHLLFYRELVIPGTEQDHVRALNDDGAGGGSPSRSRSVSMALSADEDGRGAGAGGSSSTNPFGTKPKRSGNGQLGKKRGPYRKHGQAAVASYFAPAHQQPPSSSASSVAGGQGGSLASNQFVIAQAQGGYVDENGRIRGAGAGAFVREAQNVVRWWEAGGKRAKTKKELSKLATRRARDELGPSVCADGSRDVREDESLDEVLDVFLACPVERPVVDGLPHDFLANTLGKAYASASAAGVAPVIVHSPPAPRAPLPAASFGEQFFGDRLPEAFSWARPAADPTAKSPSPSSTSVSLPAAPAPPPPPPPSISAGGSSTTTRARLAAAHDFGVFPFFTPSSIAPQGLLDDERRDFLCPPVPAPRRPTEFFSDPLLDLGGGGGGASGKGARRLEARLEAVRALAAWDDPLRKVIYGGWVGEAYGASLEAFLADAFDGAPGSGSDVGVGEEARHWVDDNVLDVVFGLEGALPLARKVAEVIRAAGGLAALDASPDDDDDEKDDQDPPALTIQAPSPSPSPPPPAPPVKLETPDVVMKAEPADDDDDDGLLVMEPKPQPPPAPAPASPWAGAVVLQPGRLASSLPSAGAIRRMIKGMPVRRAGQAHLDRLGQLPIFLSAVVNEPADFYTEPAPPAPSTAGKRRRSTVEDNKPAVVGTPEQADEDWATATLRTTGDELLGLIRAQEARDEHPRKKTRRSSSGAGDDGADGGWVDEKQATRVRLLLVRPLLSRSLAPSPILVADPLLPLRRRRRLQLSLARRVPLALLETLDADQVKLLFPDGPIGRHFEQLVRP